MPKLYTVLSSVLLLTAAVSKPTLGDPLALSNSQMDSVSAGYVSLYGDANAHAFGTHTATAAISIDVAQQHVVNIEQGVGYTVSTVAANATAIGEKTHTSVSAGFHTDEKIVSLEVQHTTKSGLAHGNSGDKPHQKPRIHRHKVFYKRRSGGNRHQKPVIYQTESLKITVVTVQPLK